MKQLCDIGSANKQLILRWEYLFHEDSSVFLPEIICDIIQLYVEFQRAVCLVWHNRVILLILFLKLDKVILCLHRRINLEEYYEITKERNRAYVFEDEDIVDLPYQL